MNKRPFTFTPIPRIEFPSIEVDIDVESGVEPFSAIFRGNETDDDPLELRNLESPPKVLGNMKGLRPLPCNDMDYKSSMSSFVPSPVSVLSNSTDSTSSDSTSSDSTGSDSTRRNHKKRPIQPKKRTKTTKKTKTKATTTTTTVSAITCLLKSPKYVVLCGRNPDRYGVKLKLCQQNVRIGCNYADMCSAAQVARAAKKYITMSSSSFSMFCVKTVTCPNKKVRVYIQNNVVQRTVLCILQDFVSVYNAKRSWKNANLVKPIRDVWTSPSQLTNMMFVDDFPSKLRSLRNGYVKDLFEIYRSIFKCRKLIEKVLTSMAFAKDEEEYDDINGMLSLLKRCKCEMVDIERSLRLGSHFANELFSRQ